MSADKPPMTTDAQRANLGELVEDFFKEKLSTTPGFETRRSQLSMALAVARTLQERGQLAVEAETGVGKSLAYLVPLLLRESSRQQPAVIATKTLQLQHQLLYKDLPALHSLVDAPRTVVQAKGWNNYLCLRKLDAPTEFARRELGSHLPRLQQRSQESTVGLTRQELNLPHRLWPLVQADPLDCQKRDCPQFGQCPLFAERRELQKADIIVTNHAFLLTDLKLRREGEGLLPPYDALVVDEAHRLDDVATDHLSVRLDGDRVFSVIESPLLNAGKGWLARVRQAMLSELPEEEQQEWNDRFDHTVHLGLHSLKQLCRSLLTELGALGASFPQTPYLPHSLLRQPVAERVANLASELGFTLEAQADELAQFVKDYEVFAPVAAPTGLLRLSKSLRLLAEDVDFLLGDEVNEWVKLCLFHPPALVARPVDNSRALGQELFADKDAVIVTSASLRVKDSFRFFFGRTGLTEEQTEQMALPSPFDYYASTFVGLNSADPQPTDESYPAHLSPHLVRLAEGLGGRTFLLTTSHRRLGEYASLMRSDLHAAGIELLVQGEASPAQLLGRFRRPEPSVLLGVDTFWEGVDVVGERLSCVVMTRIPFPVPTDPLFVARSRRLEAEGEQAFEELSLPLAALKLRQGFGRLLRSGQDKGIFLLLDPRASRRRYGQILLRHIPAEHAQRAPLPVLVDRALDWARENLQAEGRFHSKL